MGEIRVVGPPGSRGKHFPRLQHLMPGPGREAAKIYPATIPGWVVGRGSRDSPTKGEKRVITPSPASGGKVLPFVRAIISLFNGKLP